MTSFAQNDIGVHSLPDSRMSQFLQILLRLSSHHFAADRGVETSETSSIANFSVGGPDIGSRLRDPDHLQEPPLTTLPSEAAGGSAAGPVACRTRLWGRASNGHRRSTPSGRLCGLPSCLPPGLKSYGRSRLCTVVRRWGLPARSRDGYLQRVGERSAVLGADGPFRRAVRGYGQHDGHRPVPSRPYVDLPS